MNDGLRLTLTLEGAAGRSAEEKHPADAFIAKLMANLQGMDAVRATAAIGEEGEPGGQALGPLLLGVLTAEVREKTLMMVRDLRGRLLKQSRPIRVKLSRKGADGAELAVEEEGAAKDLETKDEGDLAIEELLGGKGRAVLISADAIETSRAPESGDGRSVYTRFLVEGIRIGAADRTQRCWLEARDWHLHAESRVRELAPTMTPRFFPTRGGHSIRVCKVRRDPSVAYRQKMQTLAEKRGGVWFPAGRELLAVLLQRLGLDSGAAEQIEAEVLQPFRDDEQKCIRYRAVLPAPPLP
jgi:hypothetical protein